MKTPESRPSEESRKIGFRGLDPADIPLVHRWLHTPHVFRWWYEDAGTFEEVSEQYSAYIEGREPVEPYLILHENVPIGYVQSYRVSDDEEYERLVGIEGSVGLDVFIGEEEFLYRGLGPKILRLFMEREVFPDGSVNACVIDPEPTNEAAIRAYEKAGFRHFKTAETSEGPAYFMKLTREEFFAL